MRTAHTIWHNYYYEIQQVSLKLTAWGVDWFQRFSEKPLSNFCNTEGQVSHVQGYTKQTVYDSVQELNLH